MKQTQLNKWFDMEIEESAPIYTHDSWLIKEEGTEIWCSAWERGQTIKPYGDGCHVIVGLSVYHCDELMGILERFVTKGYTWGIVGVEPTREQRIGGYWKKVDINSNEGSADK